MNRTLVLFPLVASLMLTASPAGAQEEPDPDEFTPPGYEFCGWRDFEARTWVTEWDERLRGASTVLFAREMTCRAARRNHARLRYSSTPPFAPSRTGYRCTTIRAQHEFVDVRCTKRGTSRVSFRWQSGS